MRQPDTTYSLSEIEAHVKKAVRGAGFAWGYAEEGAKAVRFLAAHQLPGAVVLAAYLGSRGEGSEVLCPLLSGAGLCDKAGELMQSGEAVVLEQLACPLLVVPYLALISRRSGVALQACWEGVELAFEEGRVQRLVDSDEALCVARAERFECGVIEAVGVGVEAGNLGQAISGEVWRALDGFAQFTYVPATEASRRGAGPAD